MNGRSKAYIESCKPPKYPYEINAPLASKGRELFEQSCARCHGNYAADGSLAKYPNKIVPIKEIGTDRVRYDAIPPIARAGYNTTWFADYGKHPIPLNTPGYIAPPLLGVWSTGPYFHNGSVPTIYHVFNQAEHPSVWKRDENGYDKEKLGVVFQGFEKVPAGISSAEARTYYDTTTPSHANTGHPYPDEDLKADEKVAVMEYLKTL